MLFFLGCWTLLLLFPLYSVRFHLLHYHVCIYLFVCYMYLGLTFPPNILAGLCLLGIYMVIVLFAWGFLFLRYLSYLIHLPQVLNVLITIHASWVIRYFGIPRDHGIEGFRPTCSSVKPQEPHIEKSVVDCTIYPYGTKKCNDNHACGFLSAF